MADAQLCTLDELTGLVEQALAVDYPGAPTGRVRDVPDQRAIRWYVTRGLVDRPVTLRGRVALYGRRHLLQLVAIKRRQAEGRSLAEIQAELTGATDEALARVARLAPERPDGAAGNVPKPPTHVSESADTRRFWAARPARRSDDHRPEAVALHGIRLAPGITLLLEGAPPKPSQLAALHAAAQPLLDLLADKEETP